VTATGGALLLARRLLCPVRMTFDDGSKSRAFMTMTRAVVLAVAGAAGLLIGCGVDCPAPEKALYSCQPMSVHSGAQGCVGGAQMTSDGGISDPDEVFPVGCMVRLPYCLGAYPGSVASCTCQETNLSGANSPFSWLCPV
jgi:hypothetical protein